MIYKILLVDDNQYLQESVQLYLQSKGYNILVASDAIEAIQLLNNEIPDLVITDIVMPKQDGYTLLKYIQSNTLLLQIPVIVLTAKGMTVDRIKAYNLGCNVYLSKPFDPNELVSIIDNLISSKEKQLKFLKQSPSLSKLSFQDNVTQQNFTRRELSVLQLVTLGQTNKDIAKVLQTSRRNVEKYVSRLLLKTKTRNRTELVRHILKIAVKDMS